MKCGGGCFFCKNVENGRCFRKKSTNVFFVKKVKNTGCFFCKKSEFFLNAGCIMYSISIFYFIYMGVHTLPTHPPPSHGPECCSILCETDRQPLLNRPLRCPYGIILCCLTTELLLFKKKFPPAVCMLLPPMSTMTALSDQDIRTNSRRR